MTLDSRLLLQRRAGVAVILSFAAVSVFFTGVFPPFANPNELSRLESVYAFVETGTFAIDGAIARLGDHEDTAVWRGHFYSNKAPGLAFAAIPVYRLLRVFFPSPESASDPVFVLLRILTVTLLCAVALLRFRSRLAGQPEGPLLLFALAFGTPLLFYGRSFFGHAWTAGLLFLAWDLSRRAEEEPAGRGGLPFAGAGLCAGWAAISEYTVAPLALLLFLRAARSREWRALALWTAGAAVPLALLAAYNSACFGSFSTLSSAREARPEFAALAGRGIFGFGLPSPRVAWNFLFHPARGLLLRSPFWIWVVPGFIAWWRSRRDRADCVFALVSVTGFFVLMTGYGNWHGGWALGNRYLLPVILFAGLALARALETPLSRGLFVLATVFSAASHLLLTASWSHFPDDLSAPAANGSLWFLARGWFAGNLLSRLGEVSLLLPLGLAVAAAIFAIRAARPAAPRAAVASAAGLALFLAALSRPPEPGYGARLFRAAIYGAYSGLDPRREELKAVVVSARGPAQLRQAVGAWWRYGARPD